MAIRNLRYEGDPLLRKVSKPVKEINDRIRNLLNDMAETMVEDHGVGLAAPQIGILKRLVVMDVGEGLFKMVNPEIIEASDEMQLDIEGCLSVPEFNGTVYRPKSLTVRYFDEEGNECRKEATGLFARCICHELDHLDGILFRDRIDRVVNLQNLDEETEKYLEDHGLLTKNGEKN